MVDMFLDLFAVSNFIRSRYGSNRFNSRQILEKTLAVNRIFSNSKNAGFHFDGTFLNGHLAALKRWGICIGIIS